MSAGTKKEKLECSFRFNVVQLCREFGWTMEYTENLDSEIFKDIITILNREKYYINQSK